MLTACVICNALQIPIVAIFTTKEKKAIWYLNSSIYNIENNNNPALSMKIDDQETVDDLITKIKDFVNMMNILKQPEDPFRIQSIKYKEKDLLDPNYKILHKFILGVGGLGMQMENKSFWSLLAPKTYPKLHVEIV